MVDLGEQDAERALADGLKPSGRPAQLPAFPNPIAKHEISLALFPPKALKTPDLRKLVGVLCELTDAFESRWLDTDGVYGPMPSLDHIGFAGSSVKDDALRDFIESQTKQLADSLLRIVARKQSSFIVRALQEVASKDITRTRFLQNLFCTSILGVANRLQIAAEKRAFEKFRRNLTNVLLNERYIDATALSKDTRTAKRKRPH